MIKLLDDKNALRNTVILCGVVIGWLLIDVATKAFFNQGVLGQAASEPFFGIFQFRLIHNTGAAWGIFGDSTLILGIFSILLCIVIAAVVIVFSSSLNLASVLGLSLVVGGGIGNAIDRFTLGYVVDFIEPVFIDFPVFNVADIGVTCGIVLFIAGILFDGKTN